MNIEERLASLAAALGTLALISFSGGAAHSQTLPVNPGPTLAEDGLGNGGFAQAGTVVSRTVPSGRVWVITGTDPDTEIDVVLPLANIESPNPSGFHARANCTVSVSRTQPDYAWGMPTPWWPEHYCNGAPMTSSPEPKPSISPFRSPVFNPPQTTRSIMGAGHDDRAEAAHVYEQKARELHGEYARTQ